jgi:hypothetical protein
MIDICNLKLNIKELTIKYTPMRLKTLFFLFLFLLIPHQAEYNSLSVVINEIAWMGTDKSANDEWMELKNTAASAVDLAGWKLTAEDGTPDIILSGVIEAGEYFLLRRMDDEAGGYLKYAGALGNGGEKLLLMNSDGEIMDMVDAATGWPAGDNADKRTMAKDESSGVWKNSRDSGGTPGASNLLEENSSGSSIQTGSQETAAPNTSVGSIFLPGSVLINEFVSDPADGDDEWIELFNKSGREIEADNWTISDGSGAVTRLSSEMIMGSFIVITKPKGNLNNGGDEIVLKYNGIVIDRVVYGGWGNDSSANAPAAGKSYATARRIDGYDTGRNSVDFALTDTLTPGQKNIITNSFLVDNVENADGISGQNEQIYITELLPDPEGPDDENEFIELFNNGQEPADLSGWILKDNSKKTYKLSLTIPAKSYAAIYRKESRIALNNSGDSVFLFSPGSDEYSRKVDYGKAKTGQSYNLTGLGKDEWVWSETLTPGRENIFKAVNLPPTVDFYWPEIIVVGRPVLFDSSDTVDPEDDKLEFKWDFGDGFTNILPNPEHTFFNVGKYNIKLTVSDGVNNVLKEKVLDLSGGIKAEIDNAAMAVPIISAKPAIKPEIRVNEIMPNPIGNDSGEWIELYNFGRTGFNLLGWRLDDEEGGSKPYILPDNYLDMGGYLTIGRDQSKIALNNDRDAVRLFDPEGVLVHQVEYEKPPEGKSYAYENGQWHWTAAPTPQSENIIVIDNGKIVKTASAAAGSENPAKSNESEYTAVSLADIKTIEAGEKIRVLGRVAVLPDMVASQYFYIVDSGAAQVYSYKKDFPKLNIGDIIEVVGEISVVNSETRIKTKSAADIRVIENQPPPNAIELACEDVNEENAGELVKIAGQITSRKGSDIFVDDGTAEVRVFIKKTSGIVAKDFKAGETVSAAGIINMTKTGPRLMPRFPEDMEKLEESDENKLEAAGSVLGEKTAFASTGSNEWTLPARDGKEELYKHILIVAGGLIILLGWWIFKIKVLEG